VTFVATSEWWRNAWKYRERTYRHAFWDSGTILPNLLAVAHGGGHRAEVVAGFVDDAVVRLLGVDPAEEAPLELVPVGSGDPAPDARAVDPIDPATTPPSDEIVDYPLVPDAWRQSRLADGEAVRTWREDVGSLLDERGHGDRGRDDAETLRLDPVDAGTASSRPVGATIERRGSLREYGHQPISRRKLATVLDRALGGVPTDSTGAGGGTRLLDYYCLVHAVEGIPADAYRYHPRETVLERVGGTDRGTAGHLALDQSVVGDAAANVYAMADVDRLVDAVGNRGYRLAQLLGGIALGRLYLATYAHRTLGGRGFTFYDDRVTGHLSPHAAGLTPTTLFALGRPADGGSEAVRRPAEGRRRYDDRRRVGGGTTTDGGSGVDAGGPSPGHFRRAPVRPVWRRARSRSVGSTSIGSRTSSSRRRPTSTGARSTGGGYGTSTGTRGPGSPR
jgi:hypothetical protein